MNEGSNGLDSNAIRGHWDLYKVYNRGFLSIRTIFLVFGKDSSTLKTVKTLMGLELLKQSKTSTSAIKKGASNITIKKSYFILILFQEILRRQYEIHNWRFLLNFTQLFDIVEWANRHSWYIFNLYFEWQESENFWF